MITVTFNESSKLNRILLYTLKKTPHIPFNTLLFNDFEMDVDFKNREVNEYQYLYEDYFH